MGSAAFLIGWNPLPLGLFGFSDGLHNDNVLPGVISPRKGGRYVGQLL